MSLHKTVTAKAQKPPHSIRKSAESVCMAHTNWEDMGQSRDMFKMKIMLKRA